MMEMPKAPPAPMPQGPEQGQAPRQPGGATQLVGDVHDKLMDFADLLSKAKGMEAESQKLGAIISQFQALVEDLGQGPGEQKPAAPQAPGAVPVEAGAKDVRPAL